MTKVRYTITIHTARTNTLRLNKNIKYKGQPATATDDSVQFLTQKIIFGGVRNSKRLSLDDICEYKQSTLYLQLLKSLLYLYLGNGHRVNIHSIEVSTPTITETRQIEKKYQPLANDFHLSKAIPDDVLLNLFDETPKGDFLRRVSTHYLKAITSKDRYFKFERLWRAFEQLAYWHLYHDHLPQKPDETEAMRRMRAFICTNPPCIQDTLSIVNKLGSRQISKLHWKRVIESNYPYSGNVAQLTLMIDNLINSNRDIRLSRVFRKAIDLRRTGLSHHGLLAAVNTTVNGYFITRVRNNSHVLSLILCKYCYFMRNKMFHGEEADFTFCFTNHTEDDDITDFVNIILESMVLDLICGFNTL